MNYDAMLQIPITLKKLELWVVHVPQVGAFRSAVGTRHERQALYVHWEDNDGNWGIGECACRPDPYFNGEFLAGAIAVLRDFVFPALPAQGQIRDVMQVLSRMRGWNFTVATVWDALFDLLHRAQIFYWLDLWEGPKLTSVPVGISLGFFESPSEALSRVQLAVNDGYRRIKLKVKPGMDVEPIAAVRAAFPNLHLAFDANGSCGANDGAFLQTLNTFQPAAIEQPFAPDRLDLCLELKDTLPTLRICLDESVASLGDLIVAHRLGALDELNIKPGRMGGPLVTLDSMSYCRQHKLPLWVGGMFETGVGRIANLRLAARLPNAQAHDLSPSRRYFPADVVQNPIDMSPDGYIEHDYDQPVILNQNNLELMRQQRIILEK